MSRTDRIPRLDEAAIVRSVKRATGASSVELGARIQSLWSGYGEIRRAELEGATVPTAIVKIIMPPARAAEAQNAAAVRSHARKLRSYEVELAFYQKYAARCAESARVPAAYFCEKTPTGALFVLEDLDASGFPARRSRPSEQDIVDCLSWLASFHATFLEQTPEALWKVGTYWHLATRPDELSRMKDDELRNAAPRIDARLRAARHRTLVHGDAKLENFCFRSGAATGVAAVDFQYVGGGVGVQDVAYFLDSCLDPASCERLAPRLLDTYFAALRRAAPPLADEVETEWRALYPFARVDFHRFLLGWAPGSYDDDPYANRLTREVLAAL